MGSDFFLTVFLLTCSVGLSYFFCVCVHADLSVGLEGACIIPGLLRSEERLQTQESGDCLGTEKGRMPQTGEPTEESMMTQI